MGSGISIGDLFGGFLVMLLGIALTDTVDDQVTENLVNLTGAAAAIADNIPLIWVMIVIGIGVVMVAKQYKDT